jgi:hypothetical protein
MPLSEQEQRLLEEMERNLYHNDADFVATVGTRRGRPNYTIVVVGVLVGVLGVGTLVAGVITRFPIVGVLGFIIMFVGVLLAITPPRQSLGATEPVSSRPRQRSSTGFMDGLNERWEKRHDDRGN